MPKIPRPKRIRVLNLSWKVDFVDKGVSKASESLGWCDYETQTICIFEDQTPESMADTFLHEILHALFYAMGIEPTGDEENVITRISTGLCTVWSTNPLAFRWWQTLL
tara:strand:- start:3774 stop:4097 length:324 start_codon:yes stop_codon:yes gene_type:complete